MKYNTLRGRLFYAIVLSLLAIALISCAATFLYSVVIKKVNEKKINVVLENIKDDDANFQEKIGLLLDLPHLTDEQKAVIYNKKAVGEYLQNKMETFIDDAGYAIFYNIQAGRDEDAIYLYACLANYYLEAGADSAAYAMILNARKLKNFYRIEDIVTRIQALHIYGRYLLKENDFEDALKTQGQITKDAQVLFEKNQEASIEYKKAALAYTAYITLMQGQTDEALRMVDAIYDEYGDEMPASHVQAYDYNIPLLYVKTHCAIRKHNYEDAIKFNSEYGKICKKFGFTMKKSQLSKDLLFALPRSMLEERQKIFIQQSIDSSILAETFLEKYTELMGNKLDSVMESLSYSSMIRKSRTKLFSTTAIVTVVFLLFLLILYKVYTDTLIDGLTKLYNRRALNKRVERLLVAEKDYKAIMIDVDNFKKLNDTMGHEYGDYVLRGIAGILLLNENRNVKCYRYGGEEMVVITEHMSQDQTVRLAEKIRAEIASSKWERETFVSASLGVGCQMPEPIKEADSNMYTAKQKGKNFTAYTKNGKTFLAERRLDIRNEIPSKN